MWFWIFFVLAFAASLASIRSYDYYWHLATGRWIVEHHAIPIHDPFATASDRVEWINDSWLFDVLLYVARRLGGDLLVCLLRAFGVAALFTTIAAWASRRVPEEVAITISALSLVGASLRFGTRPESVGIACFALLLLFFFELEGRARIASITLLTALWINLHPSALLAPFVCGIFTVGALIEERGIGSRARSALLNTTFAALSLLASPYGLDASLAPFRLASSV